MYLIPILILLWFQRHSFYLDSIIQTQHCCILSVWQNTFRKHCVLVWVHCCWCENVPSNSTKCWELLFLLLLCESGYGKLIADLLVLHPALSQSHIVTPEGGFGSVEENTDSHIFWQLSLENGTVVELSGSPGVKSSSLILVVKNVYLPKFFGLRFKVF